MPHTLFCKALFKIYPRFLYYPIKTHATSLIASIDIHSLFTHFFLCTHTSTQTHTHARMHASTYLEVGLYIANFSTLLATIPSLIPASSGLWYVCHCHVSERCCSGVQLVDMTYVCASFLLQWRTMLDLLAESQGVRIDELRKIEKTIDASTAAIDSGSLQERAKVFT